MTFTEAALEVLKGAGKPLHYKKITEIAIERNLLSHVGKTPELTMSARLATMVKMDRGDAPIVKVRPGVFAIRNSHQSHQTKQREEATIPMSNEFLPHEQDKESSKESVDSFSAESRSNPPAVALPGSDVFPEEDDDDELILADFEQDDDSADEVKGRRRRRRRRRNKDDEDNEGSAKNNAAQTRDHDRTYNNTNESNPGRRRSSNGNHGSIDWNRVQGDGELLGKDLADAAWTVLMRSERRPVTLIRVAELLVRRGRLTGHAAALAPTIAAAIRADISRSEISGSRPRFRIRNNRVELTDWLLPRDVVRLEEAAMRAAERQREQVRRGLIHKLNELPTGAFAEIVATWLNAEGVVALRAIRRSGSSGTQLHFAGTLKRGVEETRLAIVVQRNGRGVDRERVIEVRGALHHYGNATTAWLVSTSRAIEGAWEEAASAGAAPVVIFDGIALAEAMERLGIGVKRHIITVTNIDFDLFDVLNDRSEVRVRTEVDRDRERDRSRRSRRGRTRDESTNNDDAKLESGESKPDDETYEDQSFSMEQASEESYTAHIPQDSYPVQADETQTESDQNGIIASPIGSSEYHHSDLTETTEAEFEMNGDDFESSDFAKTHTCSDEQKNASEMQASEEEESNPEIDESSSSSDEDFESREADDMESDVVESESPGEEPIGDEVEER